MRCPQCGTEIPDGSSFCPTCGADLRAVAPEPPGPPAAVQPAPVQPDPAPPAFVIPPLPSGVPSAGYPKGPLGARLLAWIADGIIAGALLPVAVLLIAAASAREDAPVAGLALALIGVVWQLVYFLGRDAAGGAGFGKRLAGIVVVSSGKGIPATGGPTIVRQLVLYGLNLIPIIGNFIEPVAVLFDKQGRRLGDKAAKTQVVRASDVSARGIALKTGKGAAIGVLIVALLVMLAGSAVGGVVLARSFAGQVVAPDDFVSLETPAEEPATDAPAESPTAEPPAEPVDATEWEGQADPLNAETAVDAVGNLLNSLKNDDVSAARTYATRNFQEQESWFFAPAGGALAQFEVADVYQDAALWVVEVDEDWNSGPQKSRYFVIVEDNTPRVDGVEFQD